MLAAFVCGFLLGVIATVWGQRWLLRSFGHPKEVEAGGAIRDLTSRDICKSLGISEEEIAKLVGPRHRRSLTWLHA
jgi:hypothetical protein